MELTHGKFDLHLGIYREFDIDIYLIPPIIELYDIEITLNFPNIKNNDMIFSLIREYKGTFKTFKKTDSVSGFSSLKINNDIPIFTNLQLLDNALYSLTDLSDMLQIPEGTINSIKSLAPNEYIGTPVSNKFLVLNNTEVNLDRLFINDVYNGFLFIRKRNNEILDFSYVDGTNINFNISDVPYNGYFLSYIYVPDGESLTFKLGSHRKSQLLIDNNIIIELNNSGTYSDTTQTIELLRGWHKIEIIYDAINSGDSVDCQIYNSNNATWYELTGENISSNFPFHKLNIYIYNTKNEIIKNLIENTPAILVEQYPSSLKMANYILFKDITQNIFLLNNLKNIKQSADITINVLNGNIEGKQLPINYFLQTNDYSKINANTTIEIINNTLNEIDSLEILLTPQYGQSTIDYSNKQIKLVFYDESDNIISYILKKIDIDNSYNIEFDNNLTTDMKTYLNIINGNDFIKIKFGDFYFKKLVITFYDDFGYIKLFNFIDSKLPNFKVLGKGNKIVNINHIDTLESIIFENINLMIIKNANIPKGLIYLSEYIVITQEQEYIVKILNTDVQYTLYS